MFTARFNAIFSFDSQVLAQFEGWITRLLAREYIADAIAASSGAEVVPLSEADPAAFEAIHGITKLELEAVIGLAFKVAAPHGLDAL